MAIVTENASCTPSSISVSKNNLQTGTISWSKPTVPSGATISSCVLTGIPTISNNKISAEINGTKVTNGTKFSIDLGTSNTTTSVQVTTSVTGNPSGTVSFNDLVYTVTYENQAFFIGNTILNSIYLGDNQIVGIYIGNTLLYKEN